MASIRGITSLRFAKPGVCGLLALLLTGLPVLKGHGTPNGGPRDVSGAWSDACPCAIPCPCWRTHKSSVRTCLNIQTFQIGKGRYEGADLSGAAFVLLSLPVLPGEAPIPERLFVSDSATEKETHAIRALIERQLGEVTVSRAPLRITADNDRVEASVAGVISYRVRAAGQAPPLAGVSNYLYPWLSDVKQWTAEEVTYRSPAGERTRYSNTNSLHGHFRIPVGDDLTDGDPP
jgi:hypothetical protein